MRTAIAIAALASLASGCTLHPEAEEARERAGFIRLCPQHMRILDETGAFVGCKPQSGALGETGHSAGRSSNGYYGGNTYENVRNTPYQNAQDHGLVGKGKN